MTKLKTFKASAKLRKFTLLRAKTNNITRWSSTYEMFKRFMELKPFLSKLGIDDVDRNTPTAIECRDIDTMLNDLKKLNSITKALQSSDLTLGDVRQLFNDTISAFPQMENRLKKDADIVHCPHFESGIVKIQDNEKYLLSSLEEDAVKHLVRSSACLLYTSDAADD